MGINMKRVDEMKTTLANIFHWKPMASLARIGRMFNLNDPRWGRDKPNDNSAPDSTPEEGTQDAHRPGASQGGSSAPKPQSGPPDLDALWHDFNRKLAGLFGGRNQQDPRPNKGGGAGGPPELKGAGLGLGLVVGLVVLVWLGTGFFIVQEGQRAVITQFGKYKSTVDAGFNWRLPYPIQRHELVFFTQIRSVDVGRDAVLKATGLKESAMLTQDENILDIKFAVQYRLSDARAFLFESKNPSDAVVQAAETAVREVIGRMKMDAALSEERDQIAPKVRDLMQTILNRYNVGVEVVGINLHQGGVRPPEQVQASFDDVLKAGQERERAKNEAQAYANDVIPRAVGAASRLKEEADAYKARVVAQAQGDAQRFRSVFAEYQKAPQVTRDRMYLDAMQQIYSNVTKVVVESRQGTSLLYLPLEKILQMGTNAPNSSESGQSVGGGTAMPPAVTPPSSPNSAADPRGRDAARSRDRDSR